MATARKPRPDYLTRAAVESMIAEAVGVERARSDQALAGVMLALGGAGQAMEGMADALLQAEQTIELHAGLLGPMAEVFAAGLDLTQAAEAPAETAPN